MHVRPRKSPDGPVIGEMIVKLIDGTFWLFDSEGRRLDFVRSISVRQTVDDITVAVVEMPVNVQRDG